MSWREKKREAGHRDILVWLTPEAVTALAKFQADNPKATVAEIVSAAVVGAANSGLALEGEAVPTDALAVVNKTLADLTARVARIEAGNMTPAVETPAKPRAKTTRRPPGAPGKGADLTAIAAAVAERRVRDGEHFNRSKLYRELKEAGVRVHATPGIFGTAVRKLLARGLATA